MQTRKPHTINARLTREETLLELAEWVKDTCLLFGTSASLAYKIAIMFIAGLEYDGPGKLKQAAGNDEKFSATVDQIKRDRAGRYPPDWFKTVILGGIIEGTITIHGIDTQESFGID